MFVPCWTRYLLTPYILMFVSVFLAMNLTLFVGRLCCKNPLQLSPNVPLRPFFCITCVNVKQVVRVMWRPSLTHIHLMAAMWPWMNEWIYFMENPQDKKGQKTTYTCPHTAEHIYRPSNLTHTVVKRQTFSSSIQLTYVQCFFCDGMSRYGVPENLTTG